jgi:replicative DNA helicase
VALAQLNRGVEQRQDKRPVLSDLRDSGEIEQAADLVAFLHRDDYYNPGEQGGTIEVIVAKHRNGPVGVAELAYIKEYNRFASLERRVTA